MQQTAGLDLWNISQDNFESIASELKNAFSQVEDKPRYFDEWCKGLYLFKETGKVRILSDVHADRYEYEMLLPAIVEHLAENISNAPLCGEYYLANDETEPEYCEFEITANGQLIWK